MYASSSRSLSARASSVSAFFDGTRTEARPGGTTPRRSAGFIAFSTSSSTPIASAMYVSETGPRTSTRFSSCSTISDSRNPYASGSLAMSSVA